MTYIITSKNRAKTPNKRMLECYHPEADEYRIVDERGADKLLANQHGWDDPKPAKGTQKEG